MPGSYDWLIEMRISGLVTLSSVNNLSWGKGERVARSGPFFMALNAWDEGQ
jgi:hypothetical protein